MKPEATDCFGGRWSDDGNFCALVNMGNLLLRKYFHEVLRSGGTCKSHNVNLTGGELAYDFLRPTPVGFRRFIHNDRIDNSPELVQLLNDFYP